MSVFSRGVLLHSLVEGADDQPVDRYLCALGMGRYLWIRLRNGSAFGSLGAGIRPWLHNQVGSSARLGGVRGEQRADKHAPKRGRHIGLGCKGWIHVTGRHGIAAD